MSLKQPVKQFKTSVFRSNLFYEIVFRDLLTDDAFDNLKEFVEECLKETPKNSSSSSAKTSNEAKTKPGNENKNCGIIYCRSRDSCVQVAERLASKNVSAKAYHAGLKNSERDEIQEEWMQGKTKVIVYV